MDAAISQTIAPFTYDTLPDAAKYIRLLEVLDDEYSEDVRVRCRITTWPVDNTSSYYAISYTWGDPEPGSTILVNDRAFQIRANCEFVLRQVSSYKKTSHFWVDAICINQRHLEEKSMQVSIMGNIYKQAAQVLACVGDHADDSAFLVYKLKQHAFTKRPSFAKRLHRSNDAFALSIRFQLGQRLSNTMRFVHAVFCFMDRPYFTRLWILQELRNAQEATFLCGSDAIPRQFIYQMSEGIRYHLPKATFTTPLVDFSRRFPIFQRLYPVKVYERDYYVHSGDEDGLVNMARRASDLVSFNNGIQTLIWAAWQLECQERKDKIFGLVSLIDWGTSGPPIPDYTQTEFEVAVSFFKALLSAWYQGGIRPHRNILYVSILVVLMLQLNDNSPGVPSAVEARRIEPGIYLASQEKNLDHIHSKHSVSTGWRVSSGHLTRNESGFSTWSLPESDLGEVYLPFWVQDDDWIVMASAGSLTASVLVREVAEGLGGPLIGRAFRASDEFHTKEAPGANFKVYWGPEDLVIHAIMQMQWETRVLGSETGRYPTALVGALNTAICRNETPGSSYALRCD